MDRGDVVPTVGGVAEKARQVIAGDATLLVLLSLAMAWLYAF